MLVDRLDLINSLMKVIPAVTKDPNILGSHCIGFGRTIVAYNDGIGIEIPNPYGITGCVEAVKFIKLLKSTNESTIDISSNDTKIQIKAGKSKMSIPLQDVQLLNRFYNVSYCEKDFLPVDGTLGLLLNDAILKNQTEAPGIYVSGDDVVAMSSGIYHATFGGSLDSFRISNNGARVLSSFNIESIAVLPVFVHAKAGDCTILVRRWPDSDYPYQHIKAVIDMGSSNIAWCYNSEALQQSLQASMSVLDTPTDYVAIHFSPSNTVVKATGHNAEYENELDIVWETAESGIVKVRPFTLLAMLKKANTIELSTLGDDYMIKLVGSLGTYYEKALKGG